MPWSAPNTVNPGDIASATNYNQYLRDNLLYLLSGQPSPTLARNNAGDYTTTSTSFVDVDASNIILTATVNGGRFRVIATALVALITNGPILYFDGIMDSVTRSTGGDVNYGVTGFLYPAGSGGYYPITVIMEWTGVSVGSHTFKLQWRITSSTGTIKCNTELVKLAGWEY